MKNEIIVNYNKIIFDKLELVTTMSESEYKDFIEYNHSLDKREFKMIIFTKYKNNELVMRNDFSLIVENKDLKKCEKGKDIIIKTGIKTPIGKGTIDDIDGNKVTLTDLYLYDKYAKNDEDLYTKDIKILFDNNSRENLDFNNYINGLFLIYYMQIENNIKYISKYPNIINQKKERFNKISGMCSYMAIREVIGKDYNLSEPNVFIKDNKMEYDVLILRPGVKNNKCIYDEDDVLATVEIKTSGYFKDDFENYINNEKADGITHIYFSLHESDRESSMKYTNFRNNAISNKVIPIFCTLKKESEKFVIPTDEKLDKLLNKIKG